MRIANFKQFGIILVLSTSLAGCLSGSGGSGGGATGGSGGGGTGGDFQAGFDRVSGMAPTSNMPTEINGSYAGQMKVDVSDSTEKVGEVVGDINLDVAWKDGQKTNPFSGTASNFKGTLVSGEPTEIKGTLSVDDGFDGTIGRVVNPATNIAGVSVPATQTGSMNVKLSGELSQDGKKADTTVALGGIFHGDGGKAASGAVVGGYKLQDSTSASMFDGQINGTYYIEKK